MRHAIKIRSLANDIEDWKKQMAGDELRISAATALTAISGAGAASDRNAPGRDPNRRPRPAHVEEEAEEPESAATPDHAGVGETLDLIV